MSPLLQERRSRFQMVFRRETGSKDPCLRVEALGESNTHRCIDRSFHVFNRERCHIRDHICQLKGFFHEFIRLDHKFNHTELLRLLRGQAASGIEEFLCS